MSSLEIVAIVVVVLLFVVIVALVAMQQRKRKQLKERFGPEYDRTVDETGGRRDAERDLKERAERRDALDIRPLPRAERDAFALRWRETQEEFVDRPTIAVRQADLLVAEVMGRRGYPVGDFDEQATLVSVDHSDVVHEYRKAHEISQRNERNDATTEELRQAMVHYRALFADLLSDAQDGPAPQDGGYADDEPRRDRDRTRRS